MCKWSQGAVCSELGPAPWDTRCPIPIPAWFDACLDAFVESLQAAARGDLHGALLHLDQTDSIRLQCWFHEHGQNAAPWRAGRFTPSRPRGQGTRENIGPFMSSLYARDGYRCRYCGTRVIPHQVLRRYADIVGRERFATSGGNLVRHGIQMCFTATLDHVNPVANGGATNPENLVTACRTCNYGKAEFTLSQLGLTDPLSRPPHLTDWRGLTDIPLRQAMGRLMASG